ncbi:MAG: HAD hydrolase-like protein [Eubacteriales bacterium]
MIKHVVFDFDGTIANTTHLVPQIINEVLAEFNKRTIEPDEMRRYMQMHWKDAVKDYGIRWYELPKYAIEAQRKMHNKLDCIDLCENIKEVLVHLSKNYTTNIVSLNSKENIRKVIQKHNLNTIEEVFSTKGKMTKKRILKKYLKQFNIEKHEMLYIGDELGDIEACKKNNIKVIAVTWGYDSKEKLSAANPDYLVDSPYDIANIVSAY